MDYTWLIVLGVAAVVLLWGVGIYNGLIKLLNLVKEGWSGIETQLKRRSDLIPNIVETVKGYAGHERTALEAVMKARAAAVAAPAGPAREQAEGLLGAALGRLMMIAEAYPELKAQASFADLQAELSDIENRIAAARRFLNAAATEYNTTREQFPANLVAPMMGFAEREIAAVPREARAVLQTAPAVRF